MNGAVPALRGPGRRKQRRPVEVRARWAGREDFPPALRLWPGAGEAGRFHAFGKRWMKNRTNKTAGSVLAAVTLLLCAAAQAAALDCPTPQAAGQPGVIVETPDQDSGAVERLRGRRRRCSDPGHGRRIAKAACGRAIRRHRELSHHRLLSERPRHCEFERGRENREAEGVRRSSAQVPLLRHVRRAGSCRKRRAVSDQG